MFLRSFSLRMFGFCAVALWSVAAWSQEQQYDLVIRGGRIVDGTGNPWFTAEIGLLGDRIAFIGQIPAGRAAREIDASGLVVAPGFIDMHSHSDQTLLIDGDAQSNIRQGVTTEILGEGSSGGPNTGKIGPIKRTINGESIEIESLGDFFDALERSTISVNIASYVGINNLWRSVMGDSFETPTPEQIERMKTLLDAAMDDGALGLSTQVMTPPGSLATTDHLVQPPRSSFGYAP